MMNTFNALLEASDRTHQASKQAMMEYSLAREKAGEDRRVLSKDGVIIPSASTEEGMQFLYTEAIRTLEEHRKAHHAFMAVPKEGRWKNTSKLYAVFYFRDGWTEGEEFYGVYETEEEAKAVEAKLTPLDFNLHGNPDDDHLAIFTIRPVRLGTILTSHYEGGPPLSMKVFNSQEERIADAEQKLAIMMRKLDEMDVSERSRRERLNMDIGLIIGRIASAKKD
jgi:hypothetical protein